MNPPRASGFTLLEVLVALAVIAISLGAILEQSARYAGTAQRLREKTVATWIAHNRLTELEVQPTWPDVGSRSAQVTMAGATWTEQEQVTPTADPTERRVDVQVSLGGATSPAVTVTAFFSVHGRLPVQ